MLHKVWSAIQYFKSLSFDLHNTINYSRILLILITENQGLLHIDDEAHEKHNFIYSDIKFRNLPFFCCVEPLQNSNNMIRRIDAL